MQECPLNILLETEFLSRVNVLIEVFEILNETDTFKLNFAKSELNIRIAINIYI